MTISIIGTGYVGLVSGVCFASKGNHVICIDNNQEKLAQLKQGICPIYEPGLEDLLREQIASGTIQFSDDYKLALAESKVVFLCLPTPPKEDGSADLSAVMSVVETITPYLNDGHIIVNKSTVPVGTGNQVYSIINAKNQADIAVVSNPEFLREGQAVDNFFHPDRVVIGSEKTSALAVMRELYESFVARNDIIEVDIKSSELIKYAANSFLATKISFINEIAQLCEKVGANVESVSYGIGLDDRIGKKFLKPSIGYGGSCFPKDVNALLKTGKQHNYHLRILDTVVNVNKSQKDFFVKKIENHYPTLEELTLAVWGLAFKADTDDIRESPALDVIQLLLQKGVSIKAYDPEAMNNVKKYRSDIPITLVETKEKALEKADGLIILTEWKEFTDINWNHLKKSLNNKVIFDGRNLLAGDIAKKHNITYIPIGK